MLKSKISTPCCALAIAITCLFRIASGQDEPIPDFSFDKADKTVEAEMIGVASYYDGDVVAHDGRLWYAWLEFVPEKGDVIWIGTRVDAKWRTRHCVVDQHGEYASPTLTSDKDGRLWLSYEARNGDQWDVYLIRLNNGKPATEPQRISPDNGSDIHHDIVAAKGGLWVIWQSDRQGQFDIVARQITGHELKEVHVVGDGKFGDWHPCVTVDSGGGIHVAWDGFDGTAFNVRLRSFRAGRWGKIIDVATSSSFEGRADIVADQRNRVWISWEQGGKNWGYPFRGINTELLRDDHGPLHRFRTIHVAVLDSDGKLRRLDDPLPMPSVRKARQRAKRRPGVELTGAFYERSKLAVDAAGRVWLAYRHYYTPWLTISHRSHVEDGWGVYARCYTADGWSPLYKTSIGQGDGLQRLELAPHGNGLAMLWTSGRTHRTVSKRPRGLAAASVGTTGNASKTLPLAEFQLEDPLKDIAPEVTPETMEVGGKTYSVFYGDLHRHTDLSLCRVPIDGTLDDVYRYAIEVAKLDFLGVTDHSRDIAQGNPLSQLWWRSRKEVYRHQLVRGDAMRFVPFYAYERSHGNTADHNVISLRGDMLRPHTYPVPEFWKELDRDTMTIPHQPVRRDTWKYQDDLLRPLVEIFQGCRDNSIEEHVHRGLSMGYHLGFIASSDHMSTSASYACVWAERPTRDSIFRAMQARRTFAATDRIWLAVKTGDNWMGEIIQAKRMSPIELHAKGTATIRSVNLIVDGKPLRTWSPNQRAVEIKEDLALKGEHFIYFHLIQSDGNEAWSSPLWIDIEDE